MAGSRVGREACRPTMRFIPLTAAPIMYGEFMTEDHGSAELTNIQAARDGAVKARVEAARR